MGADREDAYHVSLAYRANRKLHIAVCSRALIDLGRDHKGTIFIAGAGRSGTTWLSDLVNYRNEYRQMFEPFHPDGPVGAIFPRHLYLRPTTSDEVRLNATVKVLSGQIRGQYMDRFNKRLISSRRIVKDIFCNLFLKWIHSNFPGLPIVLILRHPCAVLRSQAKINWERRLECMLEQETLVHDHLKPFMRELRQLRAPLEQYIAAWCIQTLVPLSQFRPGELHVVFYERLCTQPKDEIESLMAFLGRPFDSRILRSVSVASLMAFPHSAIFAGRGLVDGWKNEMSAKDLERAMELLSMFGLDHIYSDDPMPDPGGVMKFMARDVHADAAIATRVAGI